MRKTITTDLFKKIMALAKELGLSVNLGTRTNVLPHPAYKDLTTSIADEARLQMTSVEDVKSIFELSLARIAQIDEAGGNTLLHNLQTLKNQWKPPENVIQYLDPKGLGGTKIMRDYKASRKRMEEAGFDPDSNADQLKFMDIEAASKKAGTDKGVGSLMKKKTEIIPPATEGDVGAKVIDDVPLEEQGLMQQSKNLMDEVQKLSDMTKGISAQERTQINKKEMSDFIKELKEKDYAQDEIAELFDTEHTLGHIKSTILPRTDKARGFGARTKPQKDLVRDLEDSIEMYAQDDPDYLTQKYLNQKDMNYSIREAVEADLKATGKFTDDELYDLTTHNMNIDQGTNDFLMEVGTTIKLQGKGELFFPQFYENMATHYLGPIKETIPFFQGGRVGFDQGGWRGNPGSDSRPEVREAWGDFLEYRKNRGTKTWQQFMPKWIGINLAEGGVAGGIGSMFRNKSPRVGYVPGGPVLKKGAAWFIKSIRKNLDDLLANHPRYEKIPNEEKETLGLQFQALIHSLEAGDEVPKEALEAIYKNPQYYKTPRVQRGGDPEMVEVEELIQEKLLPDVSDELVNFETVGRKPNVSGGRVGMAAGGEAFKKFIEGLFIKASNQIRQGKGIFKGLNTEQKVAQHDNLTKHADKFMKTGELDKDINEFWGFDAEIAFLEAQGKIFLKGPQKMPSSHQENKILDAAYEDVAHHLKLDDLKYEADVLADSYANQLGKVYDDMADAERSALYDQSYKRLASNLKVQMDLKKMDQKVILDKIDWLVKNVSQTAETGIPPKATMEQMVKDGRSDLIDHFYEIYTKQAVKAKQAPEGTTFAKGIEALIKSRPESNIKPRWIERDGKKILDLSQKKDPVDPELKEIVKKQIIEDTEQKAILDEFDPTGRKQNAFGGGVGSMFRGV